MTNSTRRDVPRLLELEQQMRTYANTPRGYLAGIVAQQIWQWADELRAALREAEPPKSYKDYGVYAPEVERELSEDYVDDRYVAGEADAAPPEPLSWQSHLHDLAEEIRNEAEMLKMGDDTIEGANAIIEACDALHALAKREQGEVEARLPPAAQNPPRRQRHDSPDAIDRLAADIRDLNPDYEHFEDEVARMIREALGRPPVATEQP